MIKKFLTKKAVEHQLKNMPPAQRDQMQALLENNPDLMMKINDEVKAGVKAGRPQFAVMMEVQKKYQKELMAAMGAGAHQQPKPQMKK